MNYIAPLKLKVRITLLVFSLLGTSGCGFRDVSGLINDEEKNISEKLISQLQTGQIDSLYSLLSPTIKNENSRETMNKIQCIVPKEKAQDYRYLKFTRQVTGSGSSLFLRIQAEYPSNVAFYDIGFSRNGDTIELLNFHVNVTTQGNEISAPLLLRTMLHPLRFIFGILVFIIPLFSIYSLILLFRTKNVKRRWGWFVFMLFGLGQFQLNWFAGTMKFNLITFQLLGSGFLAESSYGPLFVTFAIPLGAILFLINRKTLSYSIVDMNRTSKTDKEVIRPENDIKAGGD